MVDTLSCFASALFDLAAQEHKEDTILEQLRVLNSIWGEQPEWVSYLNHPEMNKADKSAFMHKALDGQVDPLLIRFLDVCIEHDQAGRLNRILFFYEQECRKAKNIELVRVESASELHADQIDSLTRVLQDRLHKQVELQVEIVPELIAGLRVQTEDLVLDNSVLSKLNSMKQQLKRNK